MWHFALQNVVNILKKEIMVYSAPNVPMLLIMFFDYRMWVFLLTENDTNYCVKGTEAEIMHTEMSAL